MNLEKQDSNGFSLGERILLASFDKTKRGIFFSKRNIAKYPGLLYQAAKQASSQIRNTFSYELDGVCILATSGIPFGTLIARNLGLPIYLYRAKQWEVSLGRRRVYYPILSHVPENSRLILADSHMRSGRTASGCHEALKNEAKNIEIQGLVTLIGLGYLGYENDRSRVTEYPLVKMTDNVRTLQNIFGCAEEELFAGHLDRHAPTWNFVNIPTEIGQTFRPRNRVLNRLDSPKVYAVPRVLDPPFEKYVLGKIDRKSNTKVWDALSSASLINRFCLRVADLLDVKKYDILVGVNAIGSVLAWAIANQIQFRGLVFESFEAPSLIPEPDSLMKGREALVVQGRIITAQDTEETVNKIERAGGHVKDILTLLWMPEAIKDSRMAPLGRLARRNMNFITMAILAA